MGSMSIWHWIIVAMIVLLLFGRGRISEMMGDLAKGIKSFKQGMAEDEKPASPPPPPAQVQQQAPPAPAQTVQPAATPEQTQR